MNTIQLRWRTFDIHTVPALVVFLALLLTLSLAALMLATMAGVELGNQALRQDPFAAYVALWPGQSTTALTEYARQITKDHIFCSGRVWQNKELYALVSLINDGPVYSAPSGKIRCTITAPGDLFNWIDVTIDDNQIQELVLFSRVLQQNALFLYWGAPDSITKSETAQFVNLVWERKTYSALALVATADSVVKLVRLTPKGAGARITQLGGYPFSP